MSFEKPKDPLAYMENCIKRVRSQDLLITIPGKGAGIRWNTFLPALPELKPTYEGIQARLDSNRPKAVIPAIRPMIKKPIVNPVKPPKMKETKVLPAIKWEPPKKASWNNVVFVLGGPGSGLYNLT